MAESAEHITCQEVVELVTDYLERELPHDETSLFEQHLNFCDGCEWYVEQMRTTIATVGRVREDEVPPEARDRLLQAFRDWKRS
jgi:anti-sigma factor RsiW